MAPYVSNDAKVDQNSPCVQPFTDKFGLDHRSGFNGCVSEGESMMALRTALDELDHRCFSMECKTSVVVRSIPNAQNEN